MQPQDPNQPVPQPPINPQPPVPEQTVPVPQPATEPAPVAPQVVAPIAPVAPAAPVASDPLAAAPAPMSPSGPVISDPMAPVAPIMNGDLGNKPGKKKLFKIVGGVVGLAVVAIIAVAVFALMPEKILTYSESDLVSVDSKDYTAKHPSQWQDLTSNPKVAEKLGFKDGDIDQVKVYGYGYKEAIGDAQTAQITGVISLGVSDADLKTVLADSAQKSDFEKSFSDSFLEAFKSDAEYDKCDQLPGSELKFVYDNNPYVTKVTGTLACTVKEDQRSIKGTDTVVISFLIGIKNGNGYMNVLATQKQDWDKNQAFYQNSLMPSVQPK